MLRGGLIVVAAAHAAAFVHGPLFPPRTLQPRAAARLQLCAEQQAQADAQPLASGFISRRRVLEGAAGGVAISLAPQPAHAVKAGPKLDQFPEEEWQALVAQGKLSKVAFNVLHNQATERPNTSPMNKEKRPGMFSCAVCGTPLFDSATKFNSGTGWPSFYDKLAGVELETGLCRTRRATCAYSSAHSRNSNHTLLQATCSTRCRCALKFTAPLAEATWCNPNVPQLPNCCCEFLSGNLYDRLAMQCEVHCVKCGGHLVCEKTPVCSCERRVLCMRTSGARPSEHAHVTPLPVPLSRSVNPPPPPPNPFEWQGHVFDDGVLWQVPTGKRYCINGVSLSFEPA